MGGVGGDVEEIERGREDGVSLRRSYVSLVKDRVSALCAVPPPSSVVSPLFTACAFCPTPPLDQCQGETAM